MRHKKYLRNIIDEQKKGQDRKMSFSFTLVTVGVMLLYAVPGYIMIKTKAAKPEAIPAFAKLLMYVCQPCLTLYTFTKVSYSKALFTEMVIFFLFTLVLQGGILLLVNRVLRKKQDVRYRVCTVGMAFGNVGFIGVPLLESILPGYPKAVIFSSMFMLSMNILGWTVASALIANDKKYISIKKVFLNPTVLILVLALPLFFTHSELPAQLGTSVNLMGKMTTPLCMLIMGMRLATVNMKQIFMDRLQYITVAMKQLAMPLLALCLMQLLPVDENFKITMFVLCSCPVASVVLNFAEMLGEGQETAANDVLLGTMLSVFTIPLMILVL